MIILPVYRKWTWRDPPLVTLLLVLVNVIIFFGWQIEDDLDFIDAVKYYSANELSDIELPLYGDYLKENNLEMALGSPDEGVSAFGEAEVVMKLYSNPDFVAGLPDRVAVNSDHLQLAAWLELHNTFLHKLDRVNWFSDGFRPAHPTWRTAFTHMFLHGDIMHLLGNMVFLMVVGYVVEQIIGRGRFLIFYLLCGLIPVGIEVLLTPDRWVPGLGASGAVSGVMGMYAMLFGLHKIRFFYHVLFYFNYVKLPAILVLPVWLGYELLQMIIYPNSGINNLAHAGGLAGGAVLIMLLRMLPGKINVEYVEADEVDARQADTYHGIADLMAAMEYDRAVRAVLRQDDWQQDARLLHYLGAAFSHISDKDIRRTALVGLLGYETQDPKLVELQRDAFTLYWQQEGTLPKGLLPVMLPVCKRFLTQAHLEQAAILLALAMKVAAQDQRLPDLIYNMALAFWKRKDMEEYARYRNLLKKRYPATDACRAVTALEA